MPDVRVRVELLALCLLWCEVAHAEETKAPAPSRLEISEVQLAVAIVEDPDFPPIEPELAKRSLDLASAEFAKRFSVPAPTFTITNEFTLSGFLGEYALPVDPRCKPLYDARYRGGGETRRAPRKQVAMK